jgi:threonine synthase
MGWVDRMPRLIAVQSSAAPALVQAWQQGLQDVAATDSNSSAESINVGAPQDGFRALRAVRGTAGMVVAVTDAEAREATNQLARTSGIFAELASAVSVAALPRLLDSGAVGTEERIVLINTGNGLKDPLAALDGTRPQIQIPPNYQVLESALESAATLHPGDD